MVISTIVSNPAVETCGLISGMTVMGIEGNYVMNLSCPGNFEIYMAIGHAATRLTCFI